MPRFVLLEHRRGGVHWDFMLEVGEALRTWAIDAPIVAGEDLPARSLPDHRAAYLEYEGPVSGDRGMVRRVDRGWYEPVAWTPERVKVRVEGDQLIGFVELRASGAIAGSWLFRLIGKVD
ncbi:MAG TPA: DNA polymerase ligase N-terminal domain-containing protein [Isosphaeraceae bacterium]|jgi:hypothetical protein|nr:DNA polymerase ligase N-terminal domain-containing protein [Isosphaeraceae bacterium]